MDMIEKLLRQSNNGLNHSISDTINRTISPSFDDYAKKGDLTIA